MESNESYFNAYVATCLFCDGSGSRPESHNGIIDPYRFVCMTCDKKNEKGVLLNNKRMFLNNVG